MSQNLIDKLEEILKLNQDSIESVKKMREVLDLYEDEAMEDEAMKEFHTQVNEWVKNLEKSLGAKK